MGKSKAVCSADRSLRHLIFLSPVFVAVIFCFWVAYAAVGRAHVQQAFTNANVFPSKPFLSFSAVDGARYGVSKRPEYSLPSKNGSVVATVEQLKEARVTTSGSQQSAAGVEAVVTIMSALEEAKKIMRDLRRATRQHESNKAPFVQKTDSNCEGKRVFLYDLPTKFNVDLLDRCLELLPWQNMCDFLSNSGMGRLLDTNSTDDGGNVLVPAGLWYKTHQYALEVLFHKRLMHYKCLTTSTELADMFYIPYYGGLDVLRWHFMGNVTAAQVDKLGLELISWLQKQPSWKRKEGMDHVLVLGKVTWDFRRVSTGKRWGSSLLLQEEMQNLTKLLIERQPWHEHEVGVPHPTFFHPRHDKDIRTWQQHIDSEKRTHLVSFAGQPRPQQPESIRSQLIRQCNASGSGMAGLSVCRFMDCGQGKCMLPNATMELFMHSEFCMQPPGDSPTRRSVFDSLIAGCIPVLFDPYSAYYQYPWHLPGDPESYSVYIPAEDVREGRVNVIDELRKIPESVRQEMRRRIIYEVMPGLVYARPDARLREVDDAFVVSLRSVFARISERLRERFGTAMVASS